MKSKESKLWLISFTAILASMAHVTKCEIKLQKVNFGESNTDHFRTESPDRPVPLEGLTFSLKQDLNPCHQHQHQQQHQQQHQHQHHHRNFAPNDSNPISLCDISTTRVFSSRYRSLSNVY